MNQTVVPPANAGTISKQMMGAVTAAVTFNAAVADPDIIPFPNTPKKNLFDFLSGKEALTSGAYAEHIAQLDAALQAELAKYPSLGMHIKLASVKLVNSKVLDLFRRGKFDEDDSRAWPNQVEALAETIVRILNDPHRSAIIIGSTQLGKTMTALLMSVLEMLLFLSTGITYKAIYLTPPRVNITYQTKKDFGSFVAYYDFLVNVDGHEPYHYTEYRNHLRNRVMVDDNDNPEAQDCPIMPRGIKNVGELRKIIERARRENVRVIFVVDECHWGSEQQDKEMNKGKDSIMAQMLEFANALTEEDEGDIMIAISATPFNLNIKNLTRVYCRTYPNYVGYAFWSGELLDPRYPLRLPVVHPFDGDYIRTTLGIKDFEMVNRNLYRQKYKKNYDKERVRKEGCGPNKERYTPFAAMWHKKSHDEYRTFCEDKLIELVKSCLLRHNTKNAKGFIARFFLSNPEIEDFIARRQQDFGNIKLVAWNEQGAKERLDKHLTDNGVSEDDYKLILVSGNGRMGVRIEDRLRIYYGAEFSNTTTLAALLQGLLGRMTGNKSEEPVMFIDSDINKCLQAYVESRGKVVNLRPHDRALSVRKVMRGDGIVIWAGRPRGRGVSWLDLGLPDAEKFFKEFASEWLYGHDNLTTPSRKTMPEYKKKEFWDRFNGYMPMVEKALSLPPGALVLYTPEDLEEYEKPYCDDQGHSYDGTIGFRAVEKQAVANSPLKSDRMTSSNKKAKSRNLQPQLHVEHRVKGRTHTWELITMKVRFHSSTEIGENLYLPNSNDVGYRFTTDEEKQEVKKAQAANSSRRRKK